MNYPLSDPSTPLTRVFDAANCRTQEGLASLLGIRQSAVSDAKRRKSVPSEWLVCLFRLRSVNPEWVLTGCGPKYLNKDNGQDSSSLTERRPKPSPETLRLFSTKALADELVRRAGSPACHAKKRRPDGLIRMTNPAKPWFVKARSLRRFTAGRVHAYASVAGCCQ